MSKQKTISELENELLIQRQKHRDARKRIKCHTDRINTLLSCIAAREKAAKNKPSRPRRRSGMIHD